MRRRGGPQPTAPVQAEMVPAPWGSKSATRRLRICGSQEFAGVSKTLDLAERFKPCPVRREAACRGPHAASEAASS